jgi:signal peptidase I
MNRRLLSRAGAAVVALAVLGSVWFLLAPGALGGSTDYVITSGISMQPRFHTGDLALVRASSDYRVGEIVAYRSRMLQTIVLHRIVARDGDRYVFKGDNNNFRDPEHPTRSQLVGRLWLQLPGVGAKLAWLGTQRIIGVLAALAALLLTGGAASVSRRRKRRRRTHEGQTTRPARSRRPTAGAAHAGLTLASIALVAFGALAALAFTRPVQAPATTAAAYTQAGTFSYTARAPAGAVYPNGHAATGDPLFLHLIDQVAVRFDYRLDSTSPHTLSGTGTLLAQITSSTGWNHTLQLQPPTPFSGDHTLLAGTLQLRPIQALLRRVEAATAISGGVTYTLTLQPRIHTNGALAGSPLNATFSPPLAFTLDPLQLRPQLASPTAATSSTPAAATAPNLLEPAASGSVKITKQTARAFSFHKHHLTVALARKIATIGAAAALLALLACTLLHLRGRRADEPTRIQARYHHWLIPVSRSDRRSYDELVEVTEIKTLIRLAERYDRMILHEQTELGHSYRIADEGVLYVYVIGTNHDTLLPPAPPAEPAADASQPSLRTTP